MSYVKKSHTKLYLALILVVILIVASGAAAYAVLSGPKPVTAGVKVGDTFTYSIKGIVDLTGLDAVPSAGFDVFNQTDYYQVTITAVNGTSVSMDVTWRFLNGTEVKNPQTINVANGEKSDENGFWEIYSANLNIGDLLRPTGFDANHVNNTYTKEYSSDSRDTNFWFINNQFTNMEDPTQSTLMYDYRNIDFDRQTGMFVSFENFRAYNNPERTEEIVYTLTSSSVWQV